MGGDVSKGRAWGASVVSEITLLYLSCVVRWEMWTGEANEMIQERTRAVLLP